MKTKFLLAITPTLADFSPSFVPYFLFYDSVTDKIFTGKTSHSFKPDYFLGVGLNRCVLLCADDSPAPTKKFRQFCQRVAILHNAASNDENVRQ